MTLGRQAESGTRTRKLRAPLGDKLQIAVPWFPGPTIDAVLGQPAQMDVCSSEERHHQHTVRPCAPHGRGEDQGDREDDGHLEETPPFRSMRLKMTEEDVAHGEKAEDHSGVEPRGIDSPQGRRSPFYAENELP